MVEIPEARVLAAQLNETVKGRKITEVVAAYTPHKFAWFNGDPQEYPAKIAGLVVGESNARGGMLEVSLGDDMILVYSEGFNLQYIEPGGKLPAKHQLLLGFDDESALVASVRMYGGFYLARRGEYEGGLAPYYKGALEKPQVLSEDFTRGYFMEFIGREDLAGKSAKAFLATEQRFPGLGNGVLQDILYNAGVNPKTKIEKLSPEQKDTMYDSVVSTLKTMYEAGGRDSETDIFGRPGRYVAILSKDTVGKPCPKCGSMIVKENYMGGSIYYCPGCQGLQR